MKRGARAPLFVFLYIALKSFGFSLGAKQLHNNNTTTTHCLIKRIKRYDS